MEPPVRRADGAGPASEPTVRSVPVQPMTGESFAPYGEVFGLGASGSERVVRSTGFGHRGRATIGTIWNPHGVRSFSRLERHFGVTQGFVQLSGAPAVVCVAPPTDLEDTAALPDPEQVVGFHIDPSQGYLFHRGTWHSLDRYVLSPPGATFLIINSDPNPTQIVDFATGVVEFHDDLGVTPGRGQAGIRPRGRPCRFVV